MLDDYFTQEEILRCHRAEFFGAYLDTYTSAAKEHGYRPDTVRSHCQQIRHFGRWLERVGLSIGALDDGVIEKFWKTRRGVPQVRHAGIKPLRTLIEHLRAQGVIAEQSAPVRTEAQELAHRYGEYLAQRRALTAVSTQWHLAVVLRFLQDRFGRGPLRLHALAEKDITRFVLKTAESLCARTQQSRMSALRSFFRFLLEQAEIDVDLAGAVPTVCARRFADVPKYLARGQVEQLLASCERDTSIGRRDFAMLLLLARLGLRAGEVARLELDDIRWRTSELLIRGKGSSHEVLPLLADVGEALAAYIKKDRPRCDTRRVFTRVRAPLTALSSKGGVTTVVRAAMFRAGLDVPERGAYVLRHSLATRMLRDGASMSEIGVVLRHRSPATTEIYAKVDITSLSRLAQPWPIGGVR